jgi:hypothetical protein
MSPRWGLFPGALPQAILMSPRWGLIFFEKINLTKTITFVPVILENFYTGT